MAPGDNARAAGGSPLWRFSLAFYARPGVADACLALQDTCGTDVNLLLFLLWASLSRSCLSGDEIAALDDKVRDWRDGVIAPLRALRRTLKQGAPLAVPGVAEPLRAKVKALELEAERMQQDSIYDIARSLKHATGASRAAAAHHNVEAYQRYLSRAWPPTTVEVLLSALAQVDRDAFADEPPPPPR